MSYAVKEIYYTIHGEGFHAGRPSVFCRFAGCNLWSGLEEDRAEAVCDFCDTSFVGTDGPGGGRFETPRELAAAVKSRWPGETIGQQPRVVCTGGEPLLQFDEALLAAFHDENLEVAVETNGTLPLPGSVDWLCVSPKAGTDLLLCEGDELKIVYPQPGLDPRSFEQLDFQHFFLQPLDGADYQRNLASVTEYCMQHPRWRVSIQLHKVLGLP